VLYTAASLVAGRVADTLPRGRTLALAVGAWSAALALQERSPRPHAAPRRAARQRGAPAQATAGAEHGFAVLLVGRVTQGLAMAFSGPQARSLPPFHRCPKP